MDLLSESQTKMVQNFRERVKATESSIKGVISGRDRFPNDSSSKMKLTFEINLDS